MAKKYKHAKCLATLAFLVGAGFALEGLTADPLKRIKRLEKTQGNIMTLIEELRAQLTRVNDTTTEFGTVVSGVSGKLSQVLAEDSDLKQQLADKGITAEDVAALAKIGDTLQADLVSLSPAPDPSPVTDIPVASTPSPTEPTPGAPTETAPTEPTSTTEPVEAPAPSEDEPALA